MDKLNENIKKLKELFPEIFSEREAIENMRVVLKNGSFVDSVVNLSILKQNSIDKVVRV